MGITGLIRKNMRRVKTASYFITLHSFIPWTGYPVEFTARLLGGRLYYTITVMNLYSSSSLYDGDNFDDCFDLYVEVISAWKGITEAENVAKMKKDFEQKAKKLLLETAEYKVKERNHLYFKKPLFLGINDPC